MAPRKQGKRKSSSLEPKKLGTRDDRRRYLIFCEDTYGGTTYFSEMKRELSSANISIQMGNTYGEAYKLVNAARKRKEEASRRRGDQGEPYDEVWCVVDVEAPSPQGSLAEAARLADQSGIKIAYANPCFELWLFLHQGDAGGYLTTKQAIERMKAIGCCYGRNKDFDPRHFSGAERSQAIKRAKRLAQRYGADISPRDRNPWTNIHLLVGSLLGET